MEGLTDNLAFIAVSVFTFFVQICMVLKVPYLVRAHEISKSEWGSCIAVGATTLLVGPILKKLLQFGSGKMAFMYKFFDENKELKNNKILNAYDKIANAKIGEDEVKKGEKDDFTKV